MKNFIEELYYGNLDPQARAIKPNTEVERQMNVLDNNIKLTACRYKNIRIYIDFIRKYGYNVIALNYPLVSVT